MAEFPNAFSPFPIAHSGLLGHWSFIIGHFSLSPYGLLLLTGIALSLTLWSRLARQNRRLLLVYVAALVGALLGAKLVYLLAEGWVDWPRPDRWARWATGKTILGGLLGGYIAVELAKKKLHYTGITGDWFALIVPIGIITGRLGCWFDGCCLGRICDPAWFTVNDSQGIPRWPAVPMEIIFNLAMLALFLALRQIKIPRSSDPPSACLLAGQHFHFYLIAYGLFRFGHEFLRASPRWLGPFTGYHFAALAVAGWGIICFLKRRRLSPSPLPPAAIPAS